MTDSGEAKRADSMSHLAGKYLTFRLADEDYGLEILKVREIIGVLDITPVPQTAPFLLGVINLRGKVIPVIDLRLRFMLEYRQPDERTCIIVVEVANDIGQRVLTGVVVDQVSEVLNVGADDIEPPPSMGLEVDTSYLLGVAKADGGVKLLLEIDRILADQRLVLD